MDSVGFLFPQSVTGISGFRWSHHAIYTDLSTERRTQTDRNHFVDEGQDVFGDVGTLKVPASTSAFTGDAFTDGVEGEEMHG